MSAWLHQAGQRLSDLAWGAYEHAPQPLIDVAEYFAPWSQMVRDWRVPLNIFHGPIHGDKQASVLVAGRGNSIEYMLGRFFTQPPRCEEVGTVQLAALSRTLRRMRGTADMTLAQVPRLLSRWFGGGEYFQVPPWIGTQLSVPDHPEQYARRNKHVWEELRPARHNDLRPTISLDPAEFEFFYHEMYLPYALRRFGKNAEFRPFKQMRRAFRNSTMVWISRGEERIAGALLWQRAHRMALAWLGLAGTGEAARKAGAISAIYYFGIEHAKERGCITVDFGNCRPSPRDGVTWFKRKWDVQLTLRHTMKTELLFRWEQPNDAVRSFLSHTPLIIRQGKELSLVVAGENSNAQRARDLLWMNGLQRMYILNDHANTNDSIMPGVSLAEPDDA
jgi:Acetyltransferase (GNAT) domain